MAGRASCGEPPGNHTAPALWARRPELAKEISESKRNSDYLPGVNLPRTLWSSHVVEEVLDRQ